MPLTKADLLKRRDQLLIMRTQHERQMYACAGAVEQINVLLAMMEAEETSQAETAEVPAATEEQVVEAKPEEPRVVSGDHKKRPQQ